MYTIDIHNMLNNILFCKNETNKKSKYVLTKMILNKEKLTKTESF